MDVRNDTSKDSPSHWIERGQILGRGETLQIRAAHLGALQEERGEVLVDSHLRQPVIRHGPLLY